MTNLPDWVRQLDMGPHPEGGFFRETWRSELVVGESALPPDYNGPRNAGTAIYFVPLPGQQSAWHTVRSAELWLYHRGSPLLLDIGPEGQRHNGWSCPDIVAGEQPQVLVPARLLERAHPARQRADAGQLRGRAWLRLRRFRAGRT